MRTSVISTKRACPRGAGSFTSRIAAAKARRFVLLTGETDPNREHMTDMAAAYAVDDFRNVRLLVIPGLGHALPAALDFEGAIGFLEGSSPTP